MPSPEPPRRTRYTCSFSGMLLDPREQDTLCCAACGRHVSAILNAAGERAVPWHNELTKREYAAMRRQARRG